MLYGTMKRDITYPNGGDIWGKYACYKVFGKHRSVSMAFLIYRAGEKKCF